MKPNAVPLPYRSRKVNEQFGTGILFGNQRCRERASVAHGEYIQVLSRPSDALMQPVAAQLGHGVVLFLVLACDELRLGDEVVRDRDRCFFVRPSWLRLLLVRCDGLGEELGQMTRGSAKADGGGSGSEKVVELRGDIGPVSCDSTNC